MPADPVRSTGHAAIILAAGASRRLGQPKQLVPSRDGTLLINTVLAALDSPTWPVVVVLGAHAAEIKPRLAALPVLITENLQWESGMGSSLVRGLQTAVAFSRHLAGVIIAPCDQPALRGIHFTTLIEQAQHEHKRVAAHRYAGQLGAPTWFDASFFPQLTNLTGDAGARVLLRQLPETEIAICDAADLALDIDTPTDLLRFQQDEERER